MGQSSTATAAERAEQFELLRRRRADSKRPAELTDGWRRMSAAELAHGSRSYLAIERHGS